MRATFPGCSLQSVCISLKRPFNVRSTITLPVSMYILQVTANFRAVKDDLLVRATSTELVFPGYQALYSSKFFKNAQPEDAETALKEKNATLSNLQVWVPQTTLLPLEEVGLWHINRHNLAIIRLQDTISVIKCQSMQQMYCQLYTSIQEFVHVFLRHNTKCSAKATSAEPFNWMCGPIKSEHSPSEEEIYLIDTLKVSRSDHMD